MSGADPPTVAAYVRRIVKNYDKEGLAAKVRFIARIQSWATTKQLDDVLKCCPPEVLAKFLMENSVPRCGMVAAPPGSAVPYSTCHELGFQET